MEEEEEGRNRSEDEFPPPHNSFSRAIQPQNRAFFRLSTRGKSIIVRKSFNILVYVINVECICYKFPLCTI